MRWIKGRNDIPVTNDVGVYAEPAQDVTLAAFDILDFLL